ncbi:MAG: 50S ribosomal protein L22 [uncultured bacterium]|nr:MAG: 50S ribosomal protein L22 [uncultured bacterium]
MQVKAKIKHLRIAPRKVRLVAGVIRGLDVELAVHKLAVMDQRSVTPILKLVNSAIASAEHNYELSKSNLYIEAITVNDGPTLYRWMQKAFGRATPLRHRTSIVDITLAEKKPSDGNKKNKQNKSIDDKISTETVVEPIKEAKDIKKEDYKDVNHSASLRKGSKNSLIKKVFPRKTGM